MNDDYDREEPCPACGADIMVIATLDAGECPECGTSRKQLFAIAKASDADVEADASSQAALTDGGVADGE